MAGFLEYVRSLLGDGPSRPSAGSGEYRNPYQYDVDPYLDVDPALLSHAENGSFPVDLEEPRVMTTDIGGKIWVGGKHELVRYTARGRAEARFTVPEPVTALCLHADRMVYIAGGRTIRTLSGGSTRIWTRLDEQAHITSLVLYDTTFFAADAGNRIIVRLDRTGTVTGTLGKKDPAAGIPGLIIPSPFFDIRPGADGTLWAANTGRRSLEKYSPDGRLLLSWGVSSFDIEGFCGCCNPSHFYLLPAGGFVTAEKGLVRVKTYGPDGKLASVVAPPTDFDAGTPFVDIAPGPDNSVLILDPKKMKVRIYEKRNA